MIIAEVPLQCKHCGQGMVLKVMPPVQIPDGIPYSITNLDEDFSVPGGVHHTIKGWIHGPCGGHNVLVILYSMRRCAYCRTDLAEGQTKCGNCGAPFSMTMLPRPIPGKPVPGAPAEAVR